MWSDHIPSNFVKAVFHKFSLVHSLILCPIYLHRKILKLSNLFSSPTLIKYISLKIISTFISFFISLPLVMSRITLHYGEHILCSYFSWCLLISRWEVTYKVFTKQLYGLIRFWYDSCKILRSILVGFWESLQGARILLNLRRSRISPDNT